MEHSDHVRLIRGGLEGAGPRWLELGSGDGAFTLALADILVAAGAAPSIVAVDRDRGALARLTASMGRSFPAVELRTIAADFTRGLPGTGYDGVLAANSLHFVPAREPVLAAIRDVLAPGGRLLVVEYDADRGNPWVPHPFSLGRWRDEAGAAGFSDVREVGRVPSRFLGAMYAAEARRAAPARAPIRGIADPG